MDSRRTLPTELLIIENPSGHQNPFQGYVLEKPRTQSMDKTRDSSKPNLGVEHDPEQEISDESFTNLTVNVRNFKRNTASMISNQNQQRVIAEQESDEESPEPFARKYEEEDSKDELPD